MDDAEFWAVIGSTRRWERGHLTHLMRSFTALGPETAVECWNEAVGRADRLVDECGMDDGYRRSSVYAALDFVLEGPDGVATLRSLEAETLSQLQEPGSKWGPGRAIDVHDRLAEYYERETKEPFPHPAAVAPDRIWAQQWYSSDGLPADLDAGVEAAFSAVNASPEIVAALDSAGLRNLEMTGTLSHDATRGWLIGPREGTWIRVRNRRWDLGVSFQWDTAALRDMTYADGLRLVCDLVDTLAAKRSGFPASSEVVALKVLLDEAPQHEMIPGLVTHPPFSGSLDQSAAFGHEADAAAAKEQGPHDR